MSSNKSNNTVTGNVARFASVSTAAVLAVASQSSMAAGFAVLEQSAKRLGTAYAGGGAVAEDASSVWYNPAAATRLGQDLQLGVHYIDPSFEFSDPVAVNSPGSTTLLQNSRLKDDGGTVAVLPNFAYTARIGGGWYGGITVNVPFGLSTEYRDNWVGRYEALESEITSINLNPFVAYRIDDAWSVGLGFNVNRTEVSLSRAVDFAGVCAQLVGGACPNGTLPGSGEFDGEAEVEGDDVSYGFNLGVLWSPSDQTRVSAAYRSEVDLDLEGDGEFDRPTARGGFAALGPVLGGGLSQAFADSDVKADLTLPETFSLALFQQLTPRTALLADATYTGWSSVSEIAVEFDNPLTPDATEPLEWDDTMRYSLGLSFDYNEDWTFRTGVSYDESPVPDSLLRSPRLPDNDRTWLALGASRAITPKSSLDVGYSYILIDDTDMRWTRPDGGLIEGEYESSGHALSVAFNVSF